MYSTNQLNVYTYTVASIFNLLVANLYLHILMRQTIKAAGKRFN